MRNIKKQMNDPIYLLDRFQHYFVGAAGVAYIFSPMGIGYALLGAVIGVIIFVVTDRLDKE